MTRRRASPIDEIAAEMRQPKPNKQAIFDRTKLIYHRLIAREIRERPQLVEEARRQVSAMIDRGQRDYHTLAWFALLSHSPLKVRREITRRNERATDLRNGSPLLWVSRIDFTEEAFRRRSYRKAAGNDGR